VPSFTLFDMAQRPRSLAEFREPVLVLNFWAFWCDTWKAQLPQLLKLAQTQEELDFRLLVVSVDGQWSDARWAYLGRQRLPFPVLLDGRCELSRPLGVRRVPTVMVVNAARRVTWVNEAYPGNPAVWRAIRAAHQPVP
jgi:peroxiredoxin